VTRCATSAVTDAEASVDERLQIRHSTRRKEREGRWVRGWLLCLPVLELMIVQSVVPHDGNRLSYIAHVEVLLQRR
jgi:hypothetical protein